MQQTIYREVTGFYAADAAPGIATKIAATRHQGLGRRLAQKWDLYGVLALLASSGLYGLFVLMHLV